MGNTWTGRKAASMRDMANAPVSQGYCGVCGAVRLVGQDEPCLLVTVKHADGTWLSACVRCYKWWKIREGTKVPRLKESE